MVSPRKRRILPGILQAYSYSDSLIEIHAVPLPFTIIISAKPRVSEIARWAVSKDRIVTNYRHERVELDPTAEKIVAKLDGSTSTDQILEWLVEQHMRGILVLGEESDPPVEVDDARRIIEVDLQKTLIFLSRAALLEA